MIPRFKSTRVYTRPAKVVGRPFLNEGNQYGYTISVRLDDEDVAELADIMHEALDKARTVVEAAGKSATENDLPISDGILKARAKSSAKLGEKTVPVRIPVVDASKQPIEGSFIGSGSTVRLALDVGAYYTPADGGKIGCRAKLLGVQVLELVNPVEGEAQEALAGFDVWDTEGEADSFA